MDRETLEAELDIVLDALVRVTINGPQQFTEKKRQFLMKLNDALSTADAPARSLLVEAAKALTSPASAARHAQSDLRERIEAHLASATAPRAPGAQP